jgi:hypothetical protein
MGLIEERQRELTEVFAHLVEGLVGDHGNTAIALKVFFYFCWSFWLLCCEDEGVGCVMRYKLVYEVE